MPNTQQTKTNIIEVTNLNKSFKVGPQDIQILKNLNANIKFRDFVVIFGPSGCGKSTFLHTLLGLEPPTSGKVNFLGTNLYENVWDEDARAEFRKNHIGMVYQQANWVKSLTVRENVAFPLLLLGIEKAKALAKAYEMLKHVQMEGWANYIPTELSGGQQQRVSMARALINNPEILIADEPTGNLDFEAGQNIMRLFKKLNDEENKTIIMVTHDLEYIKYAKSAIRMLDGEIIGTYDEKSKDKMLKELHSKRLTPMNTEPEEKTKAVEMKKEESKTITDQQDSKNTSPLIEKANNINKGGIQPLKTKKNKKIKNMFKIKKKKK